MKKLNDKSSYRNKTKKKHRRMHHITGKRGGSNELMSEAFITSMYTNMWQFMNEDTIMFVLEQAKCPKTFTYKTNLYNNTFNNTYNNTICLMGPREEGHYIFIDSYGKVWGTYEMNILYKGDDGICHGFAMAAALQSCGIVVGPIFPNPKTKAHRYQNYITIFRTYAYIINNGWWDKALKMYFYGDVKWITHNKSAETKTALDNINTIIENLVSKL